MGIDQPKVSALLNGRLANFSSERLMRLLTALGHDVDIMVRAKHRNRPHRRRVGKAKRAHQSLSVRTWLAAISRTLSWATAQPPLPTLRIPALVRP